VAAFARPLPKLPALRVGAANGSGASLRPWPELAAALAPVLPVAAERWPLRRSARPPPRMLRLRLVGLLRLLRRLLRRLPLCAPPRPPKKGGPSWPGVELLRPGLLLLLLLLSQER